MNIDNIIEKVDNIIEKVIAEKLGMDDTQSSIEPGSQYLDGVSSPLVGKYCMFRTYSAGVHFGKLEAKWGMECLVSESRRVYYWKKAFTLSQLAMEGSGDISECQIAMVVNEIQLTEVIEIIPLTEQAKENLYGAEECKK